jgi:hypothetical protein
MDDDDMFMDQDDYFEEEFDEDKDSNLDFKFARGIDSLLTDPIELLQNFITSIQQREEELKRIIPQQPDRSIERIKLEGEYDLLKREMHTWRLLVSLWQEKQSKGDQLFEQEMQISATQDQLVLVRQLLQENQDVRKLKVIETWLEETYREERVLFEDVRDASYQRTFRKAKDALKGALSMHPDWLARTQAADVLDKEANEALVRQLWHMLRSGRTVDERSEAESSLVSTCHSFGQDWRAATLLGVKSALPERSLYKNTVRAIIHGGDLNSHEKAVYGALAGHLEGMLGACESWEDCLWAHVRVAIDQHVDEWLVQHCTPLIDDDARDIIAAATSGTALDLGEIFTRLQASHDSKVRQSHQDIYHTVQRLVALENYSETIKALHGAVFNAESQASISPVARSSLLRFAAHTALAIRGATGSWTDCEVEAQALLHAWIDHIENRTPPHPAWHVALYCAQLLGSREQTDRYARFLARLQGPEDEALRAARRCGLDVVASMSRVAQLRGAAPSTPSADTKKSAQAPLVALAWLSRSPSLWPKALRTATHHVRALLLRHDWPGARTVLETVDQGVTRSMTGTAPLNTAPLSLLAALRERGMDSDPAVAPWLRDMAALWTLQQALIQYDEWERHRALRPTPPSPIPAGVPPVSAELAAKQKQQRYDLQMREWSAVDDELTGVTIDSLRRVLLYPHGWLVDPRPVAPHEDDPDRENEMDLLRKMMIPKVTLLLHHILDDSQRYDEGIQLADIIADEHHKLYASFSKLDLQQFLAAVRSSSIKLLETKDDPLGYY